MIKNTKKFDLKNYEKNDQEAKDRFKLWFSDGFNFGEQYELVDDGARDNYFYDTKIIEKKTGKEICVEFEIRSEKDFEKIVNREYDTIHIPYRKIKNKNKSDTYIIMGEHRKDLVAIIKYESIKKNFENKNFENKKCFVDDKWVDDVFVNVGQEEVYFLEINETKKTVLPSKNNLYIINGDIFDIEVQYIAHQCNCLTNHSAGFAKEVFTKFPEANIYKDRSSKTTLKNLPKEQNPDQIIIRGKIINMLAQVFPGKPKFKDGIDSKEKRKEYFRNCLTKISRINNIKSVAFPYGIGCNMGGGNWEEYFSMIKDFAKENLGIKVFVVKKQ